MNFPISEKYRIEDRPFQIVDQRKVLHFDEIPILFQGRNRRVQRVFASLASELTSSFRYFYIIPTAKNAKLFLARKIDYRSLMFTCDYIYVSDHDLSDNIEQAWKVPISEIPKDWFPLAGSFNLGG